MRYGIKHPDSEVVVLDSIVLIKKDESTIQ